MRKASKKPRRKNMAWVDPNIGITPVAEMDDADIVSAVNLIWKISCIKADLEAHDLLFMPQVALGTSDDTMKELINVALVRQPTLPPIYYALVAEATSRGLIGQLQNTERVW